MTDHDLPMTRETLDHEFDLSVYDVRKDPHILDFMLLVARHKWMVMFLIFGATIGTFVLTAYMPMGFTAQSTVLPPDRKSSSGLLNALNATGALKMLKMVENPGVDLLQDVLESRSTAEAVAKDSAIQQYYHKEVEAGGTPIVDWVQQSLEIDPSFSRMYVKASIFTVWNPTSKQKDYARYTAARLVNLATDVSNQYLANTVRSNASATLQYADLEYQRSQHELDSLTLNKQTYEEKHGIASLSDQVSSLITQEGNLRASLAKNEIEEQLAARDLTPGSLDVQRAQLESAAVEGALQRYENQSFTGITLSTLASVEKGLAETSLKIKTLEPIVSFLKQEAEQQRINIEREVNLVQVLDPAPVPDRKSFPKRVTMTLIGFSIGLALSVIYVSIWTLITNIRMERRERLNELLVVGPTNV